MHTYLELSPFFSRAKCIALLCIFLFCFIYSDVGNQSQSLEIKFSHPAGLQIFTLLQTETCSSDLKQQHTKLGKGIKNEACISSEAAFCAPYQRSVSEAMFLDARI